MRGIGIGALAIGIVVLIIGGILWLYQECYTATGLFGTPYTFCQTPYQTEGLALLVGGFILAIVGLVIFAVAAGRSPGAGQRESRDKYQPVPSTTLYCPQCGRHYSRDIGAYCPRDDSELRPVERA